MNQTISQQYPFDYSDNDCLNQDRTFPAGLLSNDYVPPPFRKTACKNHSSSQSVPLPIVPSRKYSSHVSLHDSSYLSTTALLSPPDSLSGSISTNANQTSSTNFPQLPKLTSNNVSTSDHYQTLPASYSQYSFGAMETSMTDFSRPRHTLHPTSLSPPINFGSGHGIAGPYFGHTRSDTFHPTYFLNNPQPTPANFNDIAKFRNRVPDPYGLQFNPSNIMYHHSPTPQLEPPPRPLQNPQEGGPPFEETKMLYHIVSGRSQQLAPELIAGIQKGFFKVEGKWTCYRRNYFTVTCSFNLKDQAADGPFYLRRGSQLEHITKFAVSISAKTAAVGNQESEARSLVQHTPKRDKMSETTPKLQVVNPSPAARLASPGTLAVNSHSYGVSQHIPASSMGQYDSFGPAQHHQPPVSHTFERIQFQKATANNGKRRAQQQYFHVVVELLADVGTPGGSEHWITIATKQSAPMVVRGRSPGHYKDNARRDSTTSMDPDRGAGGGGDSSNGQIHMGSLLSNQSHGQMDWTPSHRHGGNYGNSSYHGHLGFGYSPLSGSSTTFTNSPTELDSEIQETSQISPSSGVSAEEPNQAFLLQGDRPAVEESFPFCVSRRKRRFEDDFGDGDADAPYATGQSSSEELHSATLDYSTAPHLKAVCAS